MGKFLHEFLKVHKTILAGFGQEGRSTYSIIRKILPEYHLNIADKKESAFDDILAQENPDNITFVSGENYLNNVKDYTLMIKSPGVSLHGSSTDLSHLIITSQTDLLLRGFSDQVIGITGTKGKSTTSSLLYHILNGSNIKALLAGNIGIPPLDISENITADTKIVAEFSSHQLEYIYKPPGISVLLNLYEEHLDFYESFDAYKQAKFNIVRNQSFNDFFIYNADDNNIIELLKKNTLQSKLFKFSLTHRPENGCFGGDGMIEYIEDGNIISMFDLSSRSNLKGTHNLQNIMAAIIVAKLMRLNNDLILKQIKNFKGLPHRLEYIGNYLGTDFYDDSIATIPEATIAAVRTLGKVDILIIGGLDRGIDYAGLAKFLSRSNIKTIIFSGPAGNRIHDLLKKETANSGRRLIMLNGFANLAEKLPGLCRQSDVCLLSPAASSYDSFESYKQKGDTYRQIVNSM
ncbi:MAG: UDP-N-acetylmuramoyl-L-alanine--D-glutamate ligase [Bacteroidales bacterium]|nr:UDP-N-acetylmuramoyl-L-alanine--D-glutamate ligase [Bacteroidales bacterium]